MSDKPIKDAAARTQALDPARSFLVKAPAGSGKTGLLTQRVLVLLSVVDDPENIVAITFTRKAAGEMRARIVEALAMAANEPEPEDEHAKLTWRLAKKALERDRARGWNLLENANRLRTMTIDSLCGWLAGRLPWLSRFGAPPRIADRPELLYREAARLTLGLLETRQPWARAVADVLEHFDNQTGRIEDMLSAMLAKRDQWLGFLMRLNKDMDAVRAELESTHADLARQAMRAVAAALPADCVPDLLACAGFAAEILLGEGATGPVTACAGLAALPGAEPECLPLWQGIADLLLTGQHTLRKSVDKRCGFPADSAARGADERRRFNDRKTAMKNLLERLRACDGLEARLAELRRLPPVRFSDSQWRVLQALFAVLPLASAQLTLVFKDQGEVDFTEVSQQALQSLGSEDSPTDLALSLDYQIHHLLIDEFQDTSNSQHELLKRLVAGWEDGDGRTLFLVGDPQQGIYRFRGADVSLFIRVREEGVGGVRLAPLDLEVNFRSQAGIVDWVNATFARVLPADEDPMRGAVTYSPSVAFKSVLPGDAVRVHTPAPDDPQAEPRLVSRIVRDALAARPDGTVAVLVRGRSHLARILPQLRADGVRFQAVEIEVLSKRPVVQDLLALTRALSHPADRVHWLAALRAPWCGLTLADLLALAGEAGGVLFERMRAAECLANVSEDGRRRLARVGAVLETGLAAVRTLPLRRWVEGIWIALGGPACVDEAGMADAAVFFDLLEKLDEAARVPDMARLQEELESLYAPPDPLADGRVQVLTVHKSKGLEYDAVILPGLERRPRAPAQQLLLWAERPVARRAPQLVLAPMRSAQDKNDALYSYIARLESERERFETGRLLYVAATRARARLHLVGALRPNAKAGKGTPPVAAPASSSLLGALWPAVEADFTRAWRENAERSETETEVPDGEAAAIPASTGTEIPDGEAAAIAADSGTEIPASPPARPLSGAIRRLASDWQLPAEVAAIMPARAGGGGKAPPVWQFATPRHVGTVMHRLFERVARDGLDAWPLSRVDAMRAPVRAALTQMGVPLPDMESAVAHVLEGVRNTLTDPRGRWLLGGEHVDAHCELPLSGVEEGEVIHVVLDRTFVDADGTRWIVDWKTARCQEGESLEEFLSREQANYRQQLERYARFLEARDGLPVKLGLYFPMHEGWVEWAPKRRRAAKAKENETV